jgi:hypothetical protein
MAEHQSTDLYDALLPNGQLAKGPGKIRHQSPQVNNPLSVA